MPLKSNNGSIRLYFTFNGTEYSMSKLGKFSDSLAIDQAYRILKAVETDISIGRFNCKDSKELFTAYHPLAKLIDSQAKSKALPDSLTQLETAIAKNPRQDRVMLSCIGALKKYNKPVNSTSTANLFIDWLDNGDRKASSINRYIDCLRIHCNAFFGAKHIKQSKAKRVKPFSKEEVKSIINWFANSQAHNHYHEFIVFLFSTGVRTNEATALKWNRVDFDKRRVLIDEAVALDSSGKKFDKCTKTDVSRYVPLTDTLHDLLTELHKAKVNDLVFASPMGNYIDSNNFRERQWRQCLKELGIEYRNLYTTRHTFCSHYIEQTKDFQKCAAITHGTKSGVQTLINHYSHLVSEISALDLFG